MITDMITSIHTLILTFNHCMKLINLLCINVMTLWVMGILSFTAFGCIDTRQFLKYIFITTTRLFKACFYISLCGTMHTHSPGHHKPWTQQQLSKLPLLKILLALMLSETLVQVIVGHPSSSFSSAPLVELHDDVLSDPSPHISPCKHQSESKYPGNMMSYF